MHASHEVPLFVTLAPGTVMLVGLFIAGCAISAIPTGRPKFVGQFYLLYDFLLHKWYFDELYDLIFVRPAFALGRLF